MTSRHGFEAALERRQVWRVPTLSGRSVTLRPLEPSDAPSLHQHLGDPAVARYLDSPPATEADFRQFVVWSRLQQKRARQLCFGLVPAGGRAAVGIIQVWPVDSNLAIVEWGFAVGAHYWGSSLFTQAAEIVLQMLFTSVGVRRLEARCDVANTRGNRVLEKLGATAEGVLRQGTSSGDQVMWSILADEWTLRHPDVAAPMASVQDV